MPDERSVALVGAGSRGLLHLEMLYEVTDRTYFQQWGKGWPRNAPEFPFDVYRDHASEVPDWIEDVSDLRASVAGVFDPDPVARERAAAVCREHGEEPPLFDSVEALAEEADYDTVVVASPNHTHAANAIPFLERGVDVFCEKPLATTLADHDRLIEADERSGGRLYVGFNMRHSPQYARLHELVAGGAVGDLGMLSAHEVRVPFPEGHYYTQAESGGTLLEKDCHDFDLFNWVIDADPVRVSAFGGQHVLDRDTDVVDHATVIVEYDDGVTATLELCLYAPFGQPGDRRYEARGSDGLVRTAPDGDGWEVFGWDTRDRHTPVGGDGEHGGADVRMWKQFLRVLAGDAEPTATPRDAKKAAAVAIAAETAIAEDRIVGIDANYDLEPAPSGG
jgi:predicted dehydrogenase